MAKEQTPMKNLFSMLDARQRKEFYELLIKIKRMHRDRLCNALILYITKGINSQFEDKWMNRWYYALLGDIKTTDEIRDAYHLAD